MSNNRAAIRYAKAVLSLTEDQKNSEETYSNMQLIATTISENDELQLMLNSSIVNSDDKKTVKTTKAKKTLRKKIRRLI